MIELKDIIHCDLKSSNIVTNFNDINNIKVNIIDFGLMQHKDNAINLISTVYIASPESLLTHDENIKNVLKIKLISLKVIILDFYQ
jgi:serine/threonine protein kinase